MDGVRFLSDEALVTRLQRAAFSYLVDYADEETGLVADTSRPGSPCSIAVVGFALSCYPVAVENGWMSRAEAAARTLKVLRFFSLSTQSEASDATGYKGFYYHFLDMRTGKRVWQCELSLVDSALLIAGILVAAGYFNGGGEESEIRDHADGLYRRVDWRWAQNGTAGLSQGWKPECGFLHYGWEGYNEALILYVLGFGSPTFPLTSACYETWSLTYQWENLMDRNVLYSGPLFTHLFSHAWIDFRGIRDDFMREKNSDYFENTKNTIAIHREYGERNPHEFEGYSRDFWGVTAGDGPSVPALRQNGRGPPVLRLYVARRALRPGRRHDLPLGDAGNLALCPRRRPFRHAPPSRNLPAGLHPGPVFQRLQPDAALRLGRMAFGRMVWARPGPARDDDRKSSHGADLGHHPALHICS
jgi:hypothetical protein